MIRMWNMYFLDKRNTYILLFLILISFVFILSFSNFTVNYSEQQFYHVQYYNEFRFETLSSLKVMVIMIATFLSLQVLKFNQVDYYLFSYRKRNIVFLSKYISTLLIMVRVMFILYTFYLLTGLMFTRYFILDDAVTDFFNLLFFSLHYHTIFFCSSMIVKKNLVVIFHVILYLFLFLGNDPYIYKEEVVLTLQFMQLLYLDTTHYIEMGYQIYYSNWYYISIQLFILFASITYYNESDIT